MQKLGSVVSPLHVCHNGSRHIHAVETVAATKGRHSMRMTNLDVPVVSFGSSSPFPTPDEEPTLANGVSYAISDNIWGTNYIMWYPFGNHDQDSQYRWRLNFD